MQFATRAIHIGQEPNLKEGGSGDVVVPIHMATTFARKEVESPPQGYEYSRTGNPTRHALELALSSLENAAYGLAFASGLAAIDSVMKLLRHGDGVIACDDLYGGTRRLFEMISKNFGVSFSYADLSMPETLSNLISRRTKMIWIETPTNPLLKLCDIRKIAACAKAQNPDALVVVDNTFASPYFQKPLSLGADISLHNSTKYLGGHSDAVGGAVITNRGEVYQQLKFIQNAAGAVPSPFDCWLTLRGIKTLALRMEKHGKNAREIAQWLERHPHVARVVYPELQSHPQYELAKKQMTGFSGIISFDLKGGLDDAKQFLSSLRIFSLAESLGGVESLIEHPARMTHASLTTALRTQLGISDALIRMSVGIEDVEELIRDLKQALDTIKL